MITANRLGRKHRTLPCLQGAASGMKAKVALFSEVRENFSEGLRFYMSLQEAISHLAQQVGDYSMTRQIQRCAATFPCPVLPLVQLLYLAVSQLSFPCCSTITVSDHVSAVNSYPSANAVSQLSCLSAIAMSDCVSICLTVCSRCQRGCMRSLSHLRA